MRRAILAALVATLLALCSSASASTLSVGGGAAQYTASSSEANHLVISFVSGYYVFTDTGVSSIGVVGTTCHSYSAQVAYCGWGAFGSIAVHLGNGGSYGESQLAMTPVTLYGGTGDDTLIGGAEADTLVTGGGLDHVTCGSGADH